MSLDKKLSLEDWGSSSRPDVGAQRSIDDRISRDPTMNRLYRTDPEIRRQVGRLKYDIGSKVGYLLDVDSKNAINPSAEIIANRAEAGSERLKKKGKAGKIAARFLFPLTAAGYVAKFLYDVTKTRNVGLSAVDALGEWADESVPVFGRVIKNRTDQGVKYLLDKEIDRRMNRIFKPRLRKNIVSPVGNPLLAT